MATKTVRLSFRGPVHFGRGRLSDGASTCDAGTLFSALFIEAVREGHPDELLGAAREGGLALSDAFPYVGDTLYLPKPQMGPEVFDAYAGPDAGGSNNRKAIRKLAYVPAPRYVDYLMGDLDAQKEGKRLKGLGQPCLHTKVDLTYTDSEDSVPYFVGGYRFRPGNGLYFLVEGDFDLEPLLRQLSYSGLGGKRSSGYGRFDYQVDDGCPPVQAGGPTGPLGLSVLLATSVPTEAELTDGLLDGARFQLARRGGFVQSQSHSLTPQKKRDLYLFSAGSTFRRRFDGGVFDVNQTPGAHPVWRYARAMWMEV